MIAMPWRELAALEGLDLTDKPIPQMFYVTTNLVNPTVKEIDAVMKRLDQVLEQRGTPVLITNYIEQTESTINTYNLFQLILQAAAALIGLVGAVGLLSTLSMSVFERQREIGVMRSVGARSFTIASQFLTEGISVGIIAWIAGIPLALGVYALLLNVTGFADTITAGLPLASIGFGLGSVLMVVTLASLLPSISAARRTVADIIRYQ
jgi:putative ABC transport system permease protein